MVHSRGRPAPNEWSDIRAEFEQMYLKQNWTLNAIKEHFAKRGFVATDRQYKTKVKAWELDRKKIKGPTWHSMYVVMKHRSRLNLSTVFLVPIRGDHIELVRSDRIIKQINRDRSGFDWNNLERAEGILNEAGVRWYKDEESVHSEHRRSPIWNQGHPPFGLASQSPRHDHSTFDEQVTGSSTDSTSPLSTHSMSTIKNHGINTTCVSPTILRSASFSTFSSMPTSLYGESKAPFSSGFVSRENSTSGVASISASVSAPSVDAQDANRAFNILFYDASCSNPDTSVFDSQTRSPTSPGLSILQDGDRHLAVRWAAVYLRSLLRCNSDHVDGILRPDDRNFAKDTFKTMLESSNKYIFSYSNWMVTALASNNQTTLLTQFLYDCCEVLDQHDKAFKEYYGASLHITLALYTANQNGLAAYYSDFMQSIRTIKTIWSIQSENYLVNQCYLAWLLLEQGRHDEAIQTLTENFNKTEQMMGYRHVVTLNYLTILARAYADTRREDQAISILQDVTNRLKDCTEPLEAYRYRQVMRLAELQQELGDTYHAESKFREVIDFRCRRFGVNAENTWQAIVALERLLDTQGRRQEAALLRQHFQDQHDQDLRKKLVHRMSLGTPGA